MEEDETGQIVPLSLFLSEISDVNPHGYFLSSLLRRGTTSFSVICNAPTTFCFSTQSKCFDFYGTIFQFLRPASHIRISHCCVRTVSK